MLARSQKARVAFFHCLRRHATPNVFLHRERTADAEPVCFLIGKLEWRVFIACDDMRHPLFLQPADRRLGRVLRHDHGVHVLALNQPIGAWGVSTVTSSSYTFLTDEMVKPRVHDEFGATMVQWIEADSNKAHSSLMGPCRCLWAPSPSTHFSRNPHGRRISICEPYQSAHDHHYKGLSCVLLLMQIPCAFFWATTLPCGGSSLVEACDRYCAHGVGAGGGELPESEACNDRHCCVET